MAIMANVIEMHNFECLKVLRGSNKRVACFLFAKLFIMTRDSNMR